MRIAIVALCVVVGLAGCEPYEGADPDSAAWERGGHGGHCGHGNGHDKAHGNGHAGDQDCDDTAPPPAYCGDGVVNGDEECDLGPANSDNGPCTTQCKQNLCGDGLLNLGTEVCDDGNTSDEDACLANCIPNVCGDGHWNPQTEECDLGTGNHDNGACLTSCNAASCGDGFVWTGVEACDLGSENGGPECPGLCGTCGDVPPGASICNNGGYETCIDDDVLVFTACPGVCVQVTSSMVECL